MREGGGCGDNNKDSSAVNLQRSTPPATAVIIDKKKLKKLSKLKI
jgi:hypothetical protein